MERCYNNEKAAISYLMRDGNLATPGSRYGSDTESCARVAFMAALIIASECGEPIYARDLDYAMGLVVNNHDDIQYLLDEYGN